MEIRSKKERIQETYEALKYRNNLLFTVEKLSKEIADRENSADDYEKKLKPEQKPMF